MEASATGKIPKIELWTYIIVWSSSVTYGMYSFAAKAYRTFHDEEIDESYPVFAETSILSNRKDIADLEWEMSKFCLTKFSLHITLSLIVTEILRKYNFTKILAIWQILISSIFIVTYMGVLNLLVMLFQPLSIIIFNFKKMSFVWVWAIFNLGLMDKYKSLSTIEEFNLIFRNNEIQVYMTITSIFWINLKCISYNSDVINGAPKDFLTFLSYSLYLPSLVLGPFHSYSDFKKCHIYSDDLSKRVAILILNLGRFIFWALFLEGFLHFVYLNVAVLHLKFLESLDAWSFYGYAFTMGSYFHMKYVVTFGFTGTISRFENISAPVTPKCIATIHLYSDMWKYFDVGLYNFLKNYIYIPSIKITKKRLLSSSLCFAFVFVWHGLEESILIWTVLNFAEIVTEQVCLYISKNYLEPNELYKQTDPAWIRRITCLGGGLLLAVSVITFLYLCAHSAVGNLFMSRFVNGDFQTNAVLLLILYCCAQISTELREREKASNELKINKQKLK